MRFAAALALVLLFASVARAEDLYVVRADVYDDQVAVGSIASMRIAVTGTDGDRIAFSHGDQELALEATLDLADAATQVQVGFAADAPLDVATPFAIHALEGSYAPLFAIDEAHVELALPADLPVGVASASRPIALPDAAPRRAPFSTASDTGIGEQLTLCRGDVLRSAARGGARWRLPPSAMVIANGEPRGRTRPVRVIVEGFAVDGWLAIRECHEGMGIMTTGGSGGCNMSRTVGRRVMLRAGTALYASASGGDPFATILRGAIALEPVRGGLGQQCDASGRCTRYPALPSGIARWIVIVSSDQGEAMLEGFVRTPAEQLRDADPTRRDAGGPTEPFLGAREWPTRPET